MRRRRLAVAVLAAALAVAAVATGGAGLRPDPGDELGDRAGTVVRVVRVVRVVDGDTIEVAVGATRETVRYIGIDTPETRHPTKGAQCFGRRAAQLNAELVDGERVRLVRDVGERDRYGRLLAYVYRVRDGLFVNAELARRGHARPLAIAPDLRHAERFATLARHARAAGRGLWSAC